ncbi:MAG: M28 family peptidase, partial [Myxococcota bacterium]
MDHDQQRALIDQLIRRVVDECPRRQATSEDEKRAQEVVRTLLEEAGAETRLHSFTFNDSIHANFVLHFGLATLGTLISGVAPRTAFALHAGTAASYWADSTRRAYVLRRLLAFKPSQNLIGTLPSQGEPTLRIVFVAHIDAAFTGLAFDPRVVRAAGRPKPFGLRALERPIAFATRAQAALAGIDLLRSVVGPLAIPLRPLELLLTLPSAMILIANLEILIRNQVVPGANDDLTGVAALPVLAHRLGAHKPPDVELVFVASGAEEASLGGSDALARDMEGIWDKERTVVIALDTLSLGELRFIDPEG